MDHISCLYTINESYLHVIDDGTLNGFIKRDATDIITFDISKLPLIGKSHEKYGLVCSYMISILNDNTTILRYNEISNIIDCFMQVIYKGHNINYEPSLRKCVLFRDEMYNDKDGAIMDLYVDIYNVLTIAKYDHYKTWHFIKYYIGLIERENISAQSKVVDTIIRSVICIADSYSSDNIGTLIDILRAEGIPFDCYYRLIFEIYTVVQTDADDMIYGKPATRLIELGIKKNIKMDNDIIAFINGSYYNPLVNDIIDISSVEDLIISIIMLTTAGVTNESRARIIQLLRRNYGCSEQYSRKFTDGLINKRFAKDELINRIIDICRREYTFKDCFLKQSKQLTQSKEIHLVPAHIEAFSFLLGIHQDVFQRELLDKNNDMLVAIYKGLVIGFRLQIPINDNTIYLYKKINSYSIQNYKEWSDKHMEVIKKSNRTKLSFIARSKLNSTPSNLANDNFASLHDVVSAYL